MLVGKNPLQCLQQKIGRVVMRTKAVQHVEVLLLPLHQVR